MSSQSGLAQILLLLILVAGLAGGVYLVQNKQVWQSKASSSGPNLTIIPSTVSADGRYLIKWSGITPPNPKDFIGLYASETTQGQDFIVGFYTSSCQVLPGTKPISSGECPVEVPAGIDPKNYLYRLYLAGDFNKKILTASLKVEVGTVIPSTATPTPIVIGAPIPVVVNPPCDSKGMLSLRWPRGSGSTKMYLLRVDRDPSSWGGYEAKPGDLWADDLIAGQVSDIQTWGPVQVESGHQYKWWYHEAYQGYEKLIVVNNRARYTGSFGPRIEGGTVSCP